MHRTQRHNGQGHDDGDDDSSGRHDAENVSWRRRTKPLFRAENDTERSLSSWTADAIRDATNHQAINMTLIVITLVLSHHVLQDNCITSQARTQRGLYAT